MMIKHLKIMLLLLLPVLLLAQTDEVVFSHKGGIYNTAFSVSLSCQNPNNHIRYTLNGNTPDANARLYTHTFQLDNSMVSSSDIYKIQISPPNTGAYYPESVMKAIVIRAAVFDGAENRVSDVATQSYFIRSLGCEVHDLPVVSICADSMSLFSYDTGILVPGVFWDPADPNWTGNYYNKGRDWERCINVEYYTTDNEGINQQAGLRTHGGNARRFSQKGLKIYAREEYGKKRFKYKFFDECDVTNYKHLVLKPFRSSWTTAGLQNYIGYLMSRNFNLDILACRPVVLFLNGEYWGIYFIQEKPDERYLENHYNIDPNTPNIIGNWFGLLEAGDNTGFMELMDFVGTADLTEEESYQQIDSMMDISNFIDYQILEIFTANIDWPANNMRCWQADGRKWRWFFYDCDACFENPKTNSYDYASNESDDYWPSNATSTLLFRSLLKNKSFEDQFLRRLNVVVQYSLAYSTTSSYLSQIENIVQGEIPHQIERFHYPESVRDWRRHCQQIDVFLRDRQECFLEQTKQFFDLEENTSPFICYPNPSRDGKISIRFDTDDNFIEDLVIYDMNGRCVFRELLIKIGEEEDRISLQLSPGVYVVKIGQYAKKIVVM